MKQEYDFSKGQRGKFYRFGVKLNFPVYLKSEIINSIRSLAVRKDVEIETIINDWLKRDIELIQSVK